MGREMREVRVSCSVSRHNSDQDRADDEAYDNLKMEIQALVASTPEYERIVFDVWEA